MLFLLAAPNILPTHPAPARGAAHALLSAQFAIGQRRPSLRGLLLRREVSAEKFAAISTRLDPLTRRAAALMSQRLDMLSGSVRRPLIRPMCLLLAVVLALPIPFGNIIPAAAIALFALALLVCDGLAVLAGYRAGSQRRQSCAGWVRRVRGTWADPEGIG